MSDIEGLEATSVTQVCQGMTDHVVVGLSLDCLN